MPKPQRTKQHRTPEQQAPQDVVDRSADAQKLLAAYASDEKARKHFIYIESNGVDNPIKIPRNTTERHKSSGDIGKLGAGLGALLIAGAALGVWVGKQSANSDREDQQPVGTEPVTTVMVEAQDGDGAQMLAGRELKQSGITPDDPRYAGLQVELGKKVVDLNGTAAFQAGKEYAVPDVPDEPQQP